MRARHGLFALGLVLVGASLAAAQTPVEIPSPPPQDWRIAWEHDKTALHHFELKIDGNAYAEIVPVEVSSGSYRTPVPSMTPGQHTIYVRACSSSKCGADAQLLVSLEVIVAPVTGLRIIRP